ncbi:hypothetical protein [Vibrio owensii]|uniref:hypothetical protein n=1 Tax=Vibrio harveyi group TaxID=717610 RepID=UPI003CC5E8AD
MKVKNNDKRLDIEQFVSSQSTRITKIEIELPKNIDLDKIASNKEFSEEYISSAYRFHKSESSNIALLGLKRLEKSGLEQGSRFKVAINLFAHQYIKNLKQVLFEVLAADKTDKASTALKELDVLSDVLQSFRAMEFTGDDKVVLKKNTDSVLSHELEQFLLELHTKIGDADELSPIKERLLIMCKEELQYRKASKITEYSTLDDVEGDGEGLSKKINKVELRKKLVALPSKISMKPIPEGKTAKRLAISVSTFFIMLAFSYVVTRARISGLDTTKVFIFVLAFLYILRDVFREEFRNYIYRCLTNRSPRKRFSLHALGNGGKIGSQQLWFDAQSYKKNKHSSWNDYERISRREKLTTNKIDVFGYKSIKTTTTIDMSPIMTAIKDSKKIVYALGVDGPVETEVRKQYLITLNVTEHVISKSKVTEKTIAYKILIDNERILKVTQKNSVLSGV